MARALTTPFLYLATLGRGGVRTFFPTYANRTLLIPSSMKRSMTYRTQESGAPNTLDFRIYFRKYSLKSTNLNLQESTLI